MRVGLNTPHSLFLAIFLARSLRVGQKDRKHMTLGQPQISAESAPVCTCGIFSAKPAQMFDICADFALVAGYRGIDRYFLGVPLWSDFREREGSSI
jgi:hypothetical protein